MLVAYAPRRTDFNRARVVSQTHSSFGELLQLPAPDYVEQFTSYQQSTTSPTPRCGLIVQSVPAVTEHNSYFLFGIG